MAVAIKCFSAALAGQVLVMLIKKSKAAFNKRNVLMDVITFVALRFQHHEAKLKNGIPGIFKPCIVLKTFIKIGRAFPCVLSTIRQAEVFNLFCKAGPV